MSEEKKWEPRVFQLPTDPEELAEGITVNFGPRYLGERVLREDMYAELGGPKSCGFDLLVTESDPSKVTDGKVTLIGPDIPEMEEGGIYPFVWILRVYGENLTERHTSLLERNLIEFQDQVEGYMRVNTRQYLWTRVTKKCVQGGFSVAELARGTMMMMKAALPDLVDAIEAEFRTCDPEAVKDLIEDYAMPIWDKRDHYLGERKDDDVEHFFGCTLCQTFAFNHVCVIAPERPPFCGITMYDDAEIIIEMDPHGYLHKFKKGAVIDELAGEYEGINDCVRQKSNDTIKRLNLYSTISYPQTS
jgi:acetyl-CoA decarbonylase/synthase complex subunit beta